MKPICEKCGAATIELVYCEGAVRQRSCWRSSVGNSEEHLHCTCLQCGYGCLKPCVPQTEPVARVLHLAIRKETAA